MAEEQLQLFDTGPGEPPKVIPDQKERWRQAYLRAYANPVVRAAYQERARKQRELRPDYNNDWKRESRRLNPDKWHEIEQRRRVRFARSFVEKIERRKVFERDGWICGICREPVDRTARAPNPSAPSLDHIVPLARGGDHSYANVQCAHFGCNAAKGDRLEEAS